VNASIVAVLKRSVTSVIGDDPPDRQPFAPRARRFFLTCWPWAGMDRQVFL